MQRAWAAVEADELAELDLALTSIPSPTGEERQVAEFLVQHMRTAGLDATYQAIDDAQGNAIGRLGGSGAGPDLLLYAPTDTAFSGDVDEELPWLGASVRADLAPQGFRDGEYVVGLGAETPRPMSRASAAAAVGLAGAALLRG